MPLVYLPLAGVQGTRDVADNYLNATTMMFVGGLIMAIGIEDSQLHRRIAIKVLQKVGKSGEFGIMAGFMICTAFLSMWVSNTATVAMMIPIVNAVAKGLGQSKSGITDRHKTRNLLLLSVAYAANIGGTAVVTGSPPNLVVLNVSHAIVTTSLKDVSV